METAGVKKCQKVIEEVNKVIIGKNLIVKEVLIAIVAGGHVLLEDIPGVGKTTMAIAFSKAMNLSYGRMQFTPDVMPSDVTGFSIYNKETGEFEYKEGVIMCNFFLADEINRTSSKTQAALLESMEEKKVTVDGKTHLLKDPFVVMATQNPIGSIGTSMLPESQLDRFMMCLSMGYPDVKSEIDMLKTKANNGNPLEDVRAVIDAADVINIQQEASKIFVHDDVYKYVVDIVNATRNSDNISLGVSPRGTVALINAAKATAYINGRDYVVPDDVKYVMYAVVNHRIILSARAKAMHMDVAQIIKGIAESVDVSKSH